MIPWLAAMPAGATSPPRPLSPLRAAMRQYYWKPMSGLFRAVELEVYRRAGVRLAGPLLDLGCGDTTVLKMFDDIGLVEGEAVGLDYAIGELHKAPSRTRHLGLLQGDARRLPFPDASFRTVLSNGVLCALSGEGLHDGLREVRRVLEPGGVFAASMPTDGFVDVQWIPKVLRAFSRSWYTRHVKAMEARIPLCTYDSAEEWRRHFERAGLEVFASHEFFSPTLGYPWSVLFQHPCRAFGLLRLVGIGPLEGLLERAMGGLLRPFAERELRHLEERPDSRRGYVLLLAR